MATDDAPCDRAPVAWANGGERDTAAPGRSAAVALAVVTLIAVTPAAAVTQATS